MMMCHRVGEWKLAIYSMSVNQRSLLLDLRSALHEETSQADRSPTMLPPRFYLFSDFFPEWCECMTL